MDLKIWSKTFRFRSEELCSPENVFSSPNTGSQLPIEEPSVQLESYRKEQIAHWRFFNFPSDLREGILPDCPGASALVRRWVNPVRPGGTFVTFNLRMSFPLMPASATPMILLPWGQNTTSSVLGPARKSSMPWFLRLQVVCAKGLTRPAVHRCINPPFLRFVLMPQDTNYADAWPAWPSSQPLVCQTQPRTEHLRICVCACKRINSCAFSAVITAATVLLDLPCIECSASCRHVHVART